MATEATLECVNAKFGLQDHPMEGKTARTAIAESCIGGRESFDFNVDNLFILKNEKSLDPVRQIS